MACVLARSTPALSAGSWEGKIGCGLRRFSDAQSVISLLSRGLRLGKWLVKRVGPTELAIHNTLKARDKHKEDAPGREWFNSTVAEVKAILDFVIGETGVRG